MADTTTRPVPPRGLTHQQVVARLAHPVDRQIIEGYRALGLRRIVSEQRMADAARGFLEHGDRRYFEQQMADAYLVGCSDEEYAGWLALAGGEPKAA